MTVQQESSWLAEEIAKTRAAREKAVSSRRKALVGVNNYPDLNGKPLEAAPASETDAAPFGNQRAGQPQQNAEINETPSERCQRQSHAGP